MTREEFSNEFDVLVSSYRRFKAFDKQEILDSIEFTEYEKSVFLTKAQQDLLINFYNGKNYFGDSFERTEEVRRYLEGAVKTKVYTVEDSIETVTLSPNSIVFPLPEDIMFITLEQVTLSDESLSCSNTTVADVYPVTQDEFSKVINNPFRGPSEYKVIRIDSGGNNAELISKYGISRYLIKYLATPNPIILVDLPKGLTIEGKNLASDCTLNKALHKSILDRAVSLAFASKQIGTSNDNKKQKEE